MGIIVTGGLVRLTGSGLGCPTWPQCVEGSYVPTREMASGLHPYIEFGNRTLTGVVGIAALLVLWAAFRPLEHRRGIKLPAFVLLAGIAIQAIIGGVSVRVDLNPFVVSLHFIVSAALVAVSTYLIVRLREGDGPSQLLVHPLIQRTAWVAAALGAVIIALGSLVTGSGPHSGDADKPERNGLDPRMISWLHADAVMLFVGLAVAVWLACRLTTDTNRHADALHTPSVAWTLVLAVTLAQGILGYSQFFAGLPKTLVLLHMLLAALFAAAITNGVLALRRR
ncbi:MAG: COX15/CtaA family protein [Micrococcales bacterium]|nr:COX15/CtaA family protein [Micrococcales bacterium]